MTRIDFPQSETGPRNGKFAAPNPPVIVFVAVLWLMFGCGLPMHQVQMARRQARQELVNLLSSEKLDKAGIAAAFDRANQNLDAAITGPCMMMAVTVIFVVRQSLKLKRRYNAIALDLKTQQNHGGPPHEEAND